MDTILLIGLAVLGFALGILLYKNAGAHLDIAKRLAIPLALQLEEYIYAFRFQETMKRIRRKFHIIVVGSFIASILFFHWMFFVPFAAGYFIWAFYYRKYYVLNDETCTRMADMMKDFVIPGREDDFAAALASICTYSLTGVRYQAPPNRPSCSDPQGSNTMPPRAASKIDIASSISQEIWTLVFELARRTSYAHHATEAAVLWSALVYSIQDMLDDHNLTDSVQGFYASTVGPMHNLPADSSVVTLLIQCQQLSFKLLISGQYDVYSEEGLIDILLLSKNFLSNDEGRSPVPPPSEDELSVFNEVLYRLDSYAMSIFYPSIK